LEEALVKAS
jgi:ribosome-binding ATPase YchF (GTP1/OBG family)